MVQTHVRKFVFKYKVEILLGIALRHNYISKPAEWRSQLINNGKHHTLAQLASSTTACHTPHRELTNNKPYDHKRRTQAEQSHRQRLKQSHIVKRRILHNAHHRHIALDISQRQQFHLLNNLNLTKWQHRRQHNHAEQHHPIEAMQGLVAHRRLI